VFVENEYSVPYELLALINDLVTNPLFSTSVGPIDCADPSCVAYLLAGGLITTTPWPPTTDAESPIVEIWNAPAIQIEFEDRISSSDQFVRSDCDVIGDPTKIVGVQICTAESKVSPGSIISRKLGCNHSQKPSSSLSAFPEIFVCANGTSPDGGCLNSGPISNISTTMTVYERQATTINSRANSSILAVTELGAPTKITSWDLQTYKTAIHWLLDYKGSGIPPGSAPMIIFWSGRTQMSTTFWQSEESGTFHNLLTVPLWYFQVNNYGNLQMSPSPYAMIDYLPPEFTTTASIARPYTKIKINHQMLQTYIILEALALAFSWLVFVIILIRDKPTPRISSYPVIDFAAKAVRETYTNVGQGLHSDLASVSGADNSRIRATLKDTRIMLRASRMNKFQVNDHDVGSERRVSLILVSEDGTWLDNVKAGMECQ